MVGRELGGVNGFDDVAAGRAGQERVVERADHVDDERAQRADVDVDRLEQQVPAEAGHQIGDGENPNGGEEKFAVFLRAHRLADHGHQALVDDGVRNAEVVVDDAIGRDPFAPAVVALDEQALDVYTLSLKSSANKLGNSAPPWPCL